MFWDIFWRDLGKRYMGIEDFKPDVEVDKRVRTMIFTNAMSYVKQYYGLKSDEEELVCFGTEKLADFYRYQVKVKKGVKDFLDHLKKLGVRMCIASATDKEYLRIAIEACDLRDYFWSVISCSEVGKGKDQPDIYIRAMEELGLSAEDICVYEDSYVALETARKQGFKTVGVYDKYNFEQDRLKAASNIYLSQDQSMSELIEMTEI